MTTSAGAASGNGRACSGVAHTGHMPCESSRRPAFCDISIRRVRFGMPRAGNGGLVARGIEHQICAGCDDVSARCEKALSLPQWPLLSLMPAAAATPCSEPLLVGQRYPCTSGRELHFPRQQSSAAFGSS